MKVTILILIDGFLQLLFIIQLQMLILSHNPYFNRWFSAMRVQEKEDKTVKKSQSLF